MGRRKFDAETIINAVEDYLAGKSSQRAMAKSLGVNHTTFRQWIINYQSRGKSTFFSNEKHYYSKELKEQAVRDYLSGKGSLRDICKKYKLKSVTPLRNWIKMYNSHEKLKASGTGGAVIMTKGRKTTFDERIEIVQYCIAHNHNYAETATKYNVSYQLRDRRGRAKPLDEMSELERLRAENKILRAEKERAEMEASFLKKLDEIERRRG